MTWVFLDGAKKTIANSTLDMEFDGYEWWVSTTNKILNHYRFWGSDSTSEGSIDLSSYLTGEPVYIKRGNGFLWVFDGVTSQSPYIGYDITGFVKVDITTKSVIERVTLPVLAHCVPDYGEFKLWFTTSSKLSTDAPDLQVLYTYNVLTKEFSDGTQIPGNKQFTPRHFIWGRDQWMFVNSFNENAVIKINSNTEAIVSTIMTNRKPRGMCVNSNRELLVSSFVGMVTSINQTTDVATNIEGLNEETDSIFDDGTYIWTVEPSLSRLTKGNAVDNYITMGANTHPDPVDPPIEHGETIFNVTIPNFFEFVTIPSFSEFLDVTDDTSDTTLDPTDYTIVEYGGTTKLMLTKTSIPGFNPVNAVLILRYKTLIFDSPSTDTQFEEFSTAANPLPTFTKVMVSPSYTDQSQVVVLSANAIHFAYNLYDSWNSTITAKRRNNLKVLGTAMVATGPEKYYGETT